MKKNKNLKMEYSDTYDEYISNYSDNKSHPLKILINLYKGKGKLLFSSVIFTIFQRSPAWVIPIITANIINIATYSTENGTKKIILNLLIAAAFIGQNILTTYIRVHFYANANRSIENTLRSTLVKKLQCLSIMFHKEIQSGRLQSKLMRDVENIYQLLNHIFLTLLFFVLDMIVIITVTSMKSPLVLLFFIFVIPFTVLAVFGFRKKISTGNAEYRKKMEETQGAVSEMLEMIPITRAHGLQETEIGKMSGYFANIKTVGYKLDKLNALFGSASWAMFQLFQVVSLSFTGYLAYKGTIQIGDVVLYQTYFTQLVNELAGILNIYPEICKGFESVNSVGEVLADENIEANHAIVPLRKLEGGVEFKDVFFEYKNNQGKVLNSVSFKVRPGESIAFVGESGSGKSTILNLLIGYMNPSDGNILIDGINKMNLDMKDYRSQIAVVPQNTILFSGTIRDNITYGLKNISDEELDKVIREVGLDEMIEKLPDGLNTLLGEHGDSLSGGQRQRISIARALIRNPKIIIFDEATSALDSSSELKVKQATENMMHKCTTFMVAHRLSTIQNADKIIVLKNGQIIETGNFEELMSLKGEFYNLKILQS